MAIYLNNKHVSLKGRVLKRQIKLLKRVTLNFKTGATIPQSLPEEITISQPQNISTPGLITIEDVREANDRMSLKKLVLPISPEDEYSKMGDEILMKIRKKMNRDSINEAYKGIISKNR